MVTTKLSICSFSTDVNTWRSSKARYIINGFSGFFSNCCLRIETNDKILLALWWSRQPALWITTEKEALLKANMLRENVGHPINKQVWGVVSNCTQRSGVLDSDSRWKSSDEDEPGRGSRSQGWCRALEDQRQWCGFGDHHPLTTDHSASWNHAW